MKPLCIVGAGWHGRECICIVRQSGVRLGPSGPKFLDDKMTGVVDSVPISGTLALLESEQFVRTHRFVIAIGNNAARVSIGATIMARGGEVLTLIHPTAVLWSHDIGIGSVIFPFAVISVAAKVGRFCIVNKHATVGHGAVMGDGANVSDAACFSGRLGECSSMGLHAVAIPGADIGDRVTVGAGGVVIKGVPSGVVVVGVPARNVTAGQRERVT